jgi:DNA-binding XRE family transcriptional regulator
MKEMHERLTFARECAGYATQKDAAAALGMPSSTYAAHENGQDGFRLESAIKYARKFKVSLDWLLIGKGKGPSGQPNKAWELYQLMAELEDDDLDYIAQAIEYARRKQG